MKLKNIVVIAVALFAGVPLNAAEKAVGGPKGGRLLENTQPQAEFFVNKERKAEINFYDTALKPAAPGEHVVTATAELKSGRAPVEFEKTAGGFVSKTKLPEGEPYRVVVQVRERANARPQNFRIELNLAECGGCQRPEYACTCGH